MVDPMLGIVESIEERPTKKAKKIIKKDGLAYVKISKKRRSSLDEELNREVNDADSLGKTSRSDSMEDKKDKKDKKKANKRQKQKDE